MGHNELLLGGPQPRARGYQRVFGLMCAPNEGIVGNDLRPQAVKNSLAYTLRRPGTDYVDVYRPGRVSSTSQFAARTDPGIDAAYEGCEPWSSRTLSPRVTTSARPRSSNAERATPVSTWLASGSPLASWTMIARFR